MCNLLVTPGAVRGKEGGFIPDSPQIGASRPPRRRLRDKLSYLPPVWLLPKAQSPSRTRATGALAPATETACPPKFSSPAGRGTTR